MRLFLGLIGLLALLPTAWAQQGQSPLEKYRDMKFPPTEENFDKGWRERVALEYEVINDADLTSLRAALEDTDPFVRSIAVRALGIRGDKASATALAALATTDREYMVRTRAIESLGFLKMRPDIIRHAKKDRDGGVRWTARLAEGQLRSKQDFASQVRKAYAIGIKPEQMGVAKVGQRAPDFTAVTSDGKPFKLSTLLGKKPIALYFAAMDS